jgi:NRPS condensation-like uncharacterized protein
MEKDPRARLKHWLTSGQARLQPLTFPQRELWETSPVPPGDAANNICSFFEIKGPVTVDRCEAAVSKIVERQEIMRTSFLPGKDRPLQVIRSTGESAFRYRELSSTEALPEGLEEVMAESFRKPFDLVSGPVYRTEMLRRGPDDHVMAFTIHHAVADGWSLGAFVEDLCTAYVLGLQEDGKALGGVRGIRGRLDPVPMSYLEWGVAERTRWQPAEIESHADYWKKRLAGSRRLWNRSGTGGDKSGPLQQWVTAIPGNLADAARSLARQSGATIFSTLLAAFQLTLFRWTGVDDIVVGTPVANRNKASVRETMGYFSGVVPLRGNIDPAQPFAERLRTVHEETMDAFAHAMPFAELAKALDEPASADQHTVFDTRFAFQNHPIPDVVLPGISTKLRTRSTGTARFDIGCEMTEDGNKFQVVWLHRPSVVPNENIHELDRLFREVLTTVCRQPEIHPAAMTV